MFEKIKEKILGNQDEINGVEILEASKIMNALGGRGNIDEIDSCVTRLRLKVESNEAVDDGELEKLGALGVIKPSEGIVQVVMGDKSASVANSVYFIFIYQKIFIDRNGYIWFGRFYKGRSIAFFGRWK